MQENHQLCMTTIKLCDNVYAGHFNVRLVMYWEIGNVLGNREH